jgi:lipopolysaccharide heptosyltransferase II
VPEVRRLLIRAPNWLGDAVMALPALEAVRHAFAGRTIVLAALPSIAPIFQERTGAAPDEILSFVSFDSAREAEQLKSARADGILLLTNSFGSAWRASRSGAAERWGYRANGRGWLLTRGVKAPRASVHQVDYYLELARGLGLSAEASAKADASPKTDGLPRIDPTPATVDRADTILIAAGLSPGARIVGFAPGAAYGHAKRWPPDRVAQVIASLSRRGVASVMVGTGADRETGRAIESSLPPDARVVNLIGRTGLRQLVGIVARCAAFVSNDSGAMHVAAALRVPVTAMFGPTDERETAPRGDADVLTRDVFCRPCMLRECPIDHRCMKRIDVEAVLQSVVSHLK